ncbi:MAG: SH3 domain-containing protein, partial [Saprospiraceae bacterium]|nr:SH3 domain-containing protein [Pyrinomonadaceae bacterium]
RIDLDPKPAVPVPAYQPPQRVENYWPDHPPDTLPNGNEIDNKILQEPVPKPKRKRRFSRALAAFVVFLAVFAGGLYATQAYLRGLGLFNGPGNVLSAQTGKANTDINLRPSPNVNNDPIGLVTKNSRVRIVKSQNNWYQVDVLEQGRQRDDQLATNRGWLNGKYVDLD